MGNALHVGHSRMVRLSVTPFLNVRITHTRVSPSKILIVSHVGGHCMRIPFSRLGGLTGTSLSFRALRTLFVGRVFLPKGGILAIHSVSSFTIHPRGRGTLVRIGGNGRFTCHFHAGAGSKLLGRDRVNLSNAQCKVG